MGVRVDEPVRTGLLCPEGHAGQQRRGHSAVLFQRKLLRALLDTVIVAEVDMLPHAHELVPCHLCIGKAGIPLGKGQRPEVVKFRGRTGAPYQTAHMPHHQGVAVLVPVHAGRKPRLRGIEPVAAYLLLEDAAVRKAYPARPLAETVRVGDYRIAVALPCAAVAAGDVVIGAFDVFTPHHAGVVWHFECVIGHEQIVVAVIVGYARIVHVGQVPLAVVSPGGYLRIVVRIVGDAHIVPTVSPVRIYGDDTRPPGWILAGV